MKKEMELLGKKLLTYWGIYILLFSIVIKIAFRKDDFVDILFMAIKLSYLFTIPGMVLLLYKIEELNPFEFMTYSFLVGVVVASIVQYYLAFVMHVKDHYLIVPGLVVVIGLIINRKYIGKINGKN